jgi:Ras GTPase-activating protein 1
MNTLKMFVPNLFFLKFGKKQSQGEQDASYKPTEVKNPEKIYATLQECRDTSGIKKTEGLIFTYSPFILHHINYNSFQVFCPKSFCILFVLVRKRSGYLYKRNDKNKKWKSMFFVLQMDGTDTHLLIFESPKVVHISCDVT